MSVESRPVCSFDHGLLKQTYKDDGDGGEGDMNDDLKMMLTTMALEVEIQTQKPNTVLQDEQ